MDAKLLFSQECSSRTAVGKQILEIRNMEEIGSFKDRLVILKI